jgi:hypothetical protein
MEWLLEFIGELLFYILFSFPGAGIRWLLHRGRIPYKKLLEDDPMYNTGAFVWFVTVVLVLRYVL